MISLISVSDKSGLKEVADKLVAMGSRLLSTGGTYQYLKDAGFEVEKVEDFTEQKEILSGRVKSLHPRIHGGILYRRENEKDQVQMQELGFEAIDVVVCNLYPFEKMQKKIQNERELFEYVDIGGPSMIRAAAKNYQDVLVLSDPSDYEDFLKNENTLAFRRKMAGRAFRRTSLYDLWIAKSLSEGLRYGENPHQSANFLPMDEGYMSSFTKLQGKELGYINYLDINACFALVCEFDEPCCAAYKHACPCGVALGKDSLEAYEKAYESDPVSIFGGIVAFNTEVDEKTALEMSKIMLHVIIAPSFTEGARSVFQAKKNLILIQMNTTKKTENSIQSLYGGILIQSVDEGVDSYEVVTDKQPSEEDMQQLDFAIKVAKHAKSNAVVTVNNYASVGIGQGNVNRIDAAKIALEKGKARVLASDGFFPFDDVVTLAAKHGIQTIVQPGGSIRDQDSIDRCNELGICMILTGVRHFRH